MIGGYSGIRRRGRRWPVQYLNPDGAFQAAGLTDRLVLAACCGVTGKLDLVEEILRDILIVDKARAVRDVATALAGGTAGQPGVVVISGTGSVALGVSADGRSGGGECGRKRAISPEQSEIDTSCTAWTPVR